MSPVDPWFVERKIYGRLQECLINCGFVGQEKLIIRDTFSLNKSKNGNIDAC